MSLPPHVCLVTSDVDVRVSALQYLSPCCSPWLAVVSVVAVPAQGADSTNLLTAHQPRVTETRPPLIASGHNLCMKFIRRLEY